MLMRMIHRRLKMMLGKKREGCWRDVFEQRKGDGVHGTKQMHKRVTSSPVATGRKPE